MGQRLRRIGLLLFWLSVALWFLPILAARALPFWAPTAITLGAVLITILAVAILHRGRKLMAMTGEHFLALDSRPPVVYLRSFSADSAGAGAVSSIPLLRFAYFTDEEQLAMSMNEIGPFVAIGDPTESLPDLGAARIYVGDQSWQQKVSDLLGRARLVIMRAGISEGFLWELHTVRAVVPPERLLLLVSTNSEEYATFRARAAGVLPHPLPELQGRTRLLSHVRAVIEFDADWRPTVLPIVRAFWRSRFTAPYLARIKATLKPVYDRLGVPWSPPVARGRNRMLIACSVVGALAALLWLAIKLPEYMYTYPSAGEIPSPAVAVSADSQPTGSSFDVAAKRVGARLMEISEVRAAMSDVSNPAEARARGRELTQRGLRRLSDDELIHRAALMNRILTEADTPTCAAIAKGTPGADIAAVVRRLTPAEIDEWFDVTFEATVAEARQQPAPDTPSQARVNSAFTALGTQLSSADRMLLATFFTHPQETADEDACRGMRLVYGTLGDLPEPHRAVLARALVAP